MLFDTELFARYFGVSFSLIRVVAQLSEKKQAFFKKTRRSLPVPLRLLLFLFFSLYGCSTPTCASKDKRIPWRTVCAQN